MTVAEDRLRAAGLELPPREGPAYDYDPFKCDGERIYLAGTLGKENGAVRKTGKVGAEIDESEAYRQMQICALQALNWMKEATGGDLDRIAGILQLKAYVACTPDFDGISRIADGASQVFMTAFADNGRHPRSVLGMMRLPQDAPVMIDLVAEIRRQVPR
ncbi:MAG: RidA family protein [Rhodospirillaceae bacterium]|jgi:enamine deaminase RidA (YjgF/YER057c/UK114 family)|nr:RidA family protein [Rhodospirillaceae bacterium]